LDRRRASDHKAKCWKQGENSHWYFQDEKTKAYWMRAQQVPGNNYNRKHGVVGLKAGIITQGKRLSEGEKAGRKLAKQRSGKQKEQVLSLHAEVIPGLEFLMSSVATDYPHLRWCHIRHRLKEAFERGMV
jgi:hypothetical protein